MGKKKGAQWPCAPSIRIVWIAYVIHCFSGPPKATFTREVKLGCHRIQSFECLCLPRAMFVQPREQIGA